MRTDLLPLCDKHLRVMELAIAPFSADYSIEFFRCTERFCGRCFSERLGYVTPARNQPPMIANGQPRCERHGRPMFITSHERHRNLIRYGCPEPDCPESFSSGL